MKSYNVLTDLQKQFFTQTKLYTTYKKYDMATSIDGKVDTIPEAIKVIVDFEKTIQETQELHDDINQTRDTIDSEKYTDIRKKMVKANEAYNFINRDFNIEGQVIRPLSLADKVALQRYKYFMTVYKVQEYLDNLKK